MNAIESIAAVVSGIVALVIFLRRSWLGGTSTAAFAIAVFAMTWFARLNDGALQATTPALVTAAIMTLLYLLLPTGQMRRGASRTGSRLIAIVSLLLIAEVWAVAYFWQQPNGPTIAALAAAALLIATLLGGFAVALWIDLRSKRDADRE